MSIAVWRAPVGAILFLSACAAPAPAPIASPPTPALSGPGLPLSLALAGEPARRLLEEVAARCWLDHVVRGGSMVVDRATGRVVITSEKTDLLIAEVVPAGDGSIVRLTGPASRDPAMAVRLSETLELAATTGETACVA